MKYLKTTIPCTSFPCKWIVPKTRKESTQQISTTVFKKHECDKPVKRQTALLEGFDPQPPEYHGNPRA